MLSEIVLLIHGKQYPEIPVDLSIAYTNNLHGLFNQLFQLVSYFGPKLELLRDPEFRVWIDVMSTDIFEGKTCPISEILDLERMNQEFGFQLGDLTHLTEPPTDCKNFFKFNGPLVFYYQHPHLFKQCCKLLRFSPRLFNAAQTINQQKNLIDKEVNLVHLRFCSNLYKRLHEFKGTPIALTDGQHNDFYQEGELYLQTLEDCRQKIYQHCDKSIPLCLLAPNKEHPFIDELRKDYQVFVISDSEFAPFLEGIPPGNDLSGICDVVWASQLKIKNFLHQADDSSNSISTYSLFLREFLQYQQDIKYFNPKWEVES